MVNYIFTPPAKKFLKKLKDKQLSKKFLDVISLICEDPYQAGEAKTGDLLGYYGYDIKHQSVHYELAYKIVEEEEQMVVILMCGTRENFYDELKRYLF
jgi:mRNA interferase RelE/StbE